jgi:hypothetical protein
VWTYSKRTEAQTRNRMHQMVSSAGAGKASHLRHFVRRGEPQGGGGEVETKSDERERRAGEDLCLVLKRPERVDLPSSASG